MGSIETRKETAVSFLRMAAAAQAQQAFERFASPGFRHHNPHFADLAQEVPADSPNASGMF